jgi:hypothetical protein
VARRAAALGFDGKWVDREIIPVAAELEWRLDDRTDDTMAFFEFGRGLITRVTDFWPEPYEPPPGREHLVERW